MWIPSVLKTVRENRQNAAVGAAPPGRAFPEIMVVTADDRLYFSVFAVCLELGWGIRRARTIETARDAVQSRPASVVVCDEKLPNADWRNDLRSAAAFLDRPAVVLAATEVNEDAWRTVLRCDGYDLIARSAASAEWKRMLRFAWLSFRGTAEAQ